MSKKINALSVLLDAARGLNGDMDFMALSLAKLERMDAMLGPFADWANENDQGEEPETATDEAWRVYDCVAREVERRRCIASPEYKEEAEAYRQASNRDLNRRMYHSGQGRLEADTERVYDLGPGVPPAIGTRKGGGMFVAEIVGVRGDELHIAILAFGLPDLDLILWDGARAMPVCREERVRIFSGIERGREYVLEMTSLGEDITSRIRLRIVGDVAFPLSRHFSPGRE